MHRLAPERYRTLCKMFLHWERSYIREEIRLWKIYVDASLVFASFRARVCVRLARGMLVRI